MRWILWIFSHRNKIQVHGALIKSIISLLFCISLLLPWHKFPIPQHQPHGMEDEKNNLHTKKKTALDCIARAYNPLAAAGCMYLITKVNFTFMQMNLSARPSLYIIINDFVMTLLSTRLANLCLCTLAAHTLTGSMFARLTFVVGVCCCKHKIQYNFSSLSRVHCSPGNFRYHVVFD